MEGVYEAQSKISRCASLTQGDAPPRFTALVHSVQGSDSFITNRVLLDRRPALTCTEELISAAKPPVIGASWLMSKRPVFTTD
ncbi:hypothetical protein EYF80_029205 [Liparis tanakae]|uniref:Uncharacterized protein n=1 Tax=Liparis tanakae TaxID=230148 RepID=A0A4Z2H708_9TELE|nr:hypothetical protein EYF80_029205 [Liparis tanakae]